MNFTLNLLGGVGGHTYVN